MRGTILVTGATDGLGRELARRAHADGWNVLAHGRNRVRLNRLAAELDGARTLRAELSSLAEVAALARAVVKATARLDVLVNNAGVGTAEPGGGSRVQSVDGHELRFAVNYLAPYSLTRRLLPLLEASAPARIVNVASAGQAPIEFDDVMLERGYAGGRAYSQSKLALIMLTLDLAAELDPDAVTANALHPGTYIAQSVPWRWRHTADRIRPPAHKQEVPGSSPGPPMTRKLRRDGTYLLDASIALQGKRATPEGAAMTYLIVGVDRRTLAPWHGHVLARDIAAAKRGARTRAAAQGIRLVIAAVIGPNSCVLAAPEQDRAAA